MYEFIHQGRKVGFKKVGYKKSKKTKSVPPKKKKKSKKTRSPPPKKNPLKSPVPSSISKQQGELNVATNVNGTMETLAQPAFVLVNYNPKLGDFTDEWDMVNDQVEHLHIGVLHYNNTMTSSFCSRVHPQDVKAAPSMLSYLFLENHHVSKEDSLLFDLAMLLVKQSCLGLNIHFNSIGKPNHMFAWFVIDFLSMLLLFDTFIDHRLLMAPAPYAHMDLTDEEQGMLKHNQKIFINFCSNQCPSIVQKYFMNARTGNIGQGCVNLDSLWATSTKFLRQFKTGILFFFSPTRQPTPVPKKNNLCGSIILPFYSYFIHVSVYT